MPVTQGTCSEMCPNKERKWREKEGLLHSFEVLDGTENDRRPKADCKKIVKMFRRSAAGQMEPTSEDIRPPSVLLKTTHYLIHNILTKEGVKYLDAYDFVFDRMRSIRQDLTVQNADGEECIKILEQCIRFYIYSGYRLHGKDLTEFDPFINTTHLQECLKKVIVLYIENYPDSPNHAEMEAVYLLLNLGSPEALQHSLSLPQKLRCHSLIQQSYKISIAHLLGNFVYVFRSIDRLPFLLACCLSQHLSLLRRRALQVMTVAYSSRNLCFPVKILSKWLNCAESEAEALCLHYELSVNNGHVNFLKGKGNFSRHSFQCSSPKSLLEQDRKINLPSLLCCMTSNC